MPARNVSLATAVAVAVGGGIAVGLMFHGGLSSTGRTGSPAIAETSTTAAAGAPSPSARSITVQATGLVSGTPDLMTINLGVQVQASSAATALEQSNVKAKALIDTLIGAGVAKVDVQTSNLSIWPQYDTNGQRIIGYRASNNVTAKLRDLAKAGTVIDAAAGAAGDAITINGISLSIDDTSALHAKARELAVQQAKRQADQLAAAAGVTAGKVISISEIAQEIPRPYAAAVQAAGGAKSSVPIEPGTQEIQLQVTVVYELS